MNRRDIDLDFTSLLDVTLIVIFFFVLFSHLDSKENQARIDEKVKEYEVAIQQAEKKELLAEELEEQLRNEIDIVTQSDERRGENSKEIIDFNLGDNIKIIMKTDTSPWSVSVVKNGNLLCNIFSDNYFKVNLEKTFKDAGYDSDSTIFCEFIYDGAEPDSRAAYILVKECLSDISGKYKYLYISETNLSIGG